MLLREERGSGFLHQSPTHACRDVIFDRGPEAWEPGKMDFMRRREGLRRYQYPCDSAEMSALHAHSRLVRR